MREDDIRKMSKLVKLGQENGDDRSKRFRVKGVKNESR